MALHHTHDGSFRCSKSNTHSYYTSNFESANKNPSFIQGSSVFPDVVSVSGYHSYKEKTIKLLPYHSFYGGHITQEKLNPFSGKIHQDAHLAAFP